MSNFHVNNNPWPHETLLFSKLQQKCSVNFGTSDVIRSIDDTKMRL